MDNNSSKATQLESFPLTVAIEALRAATSVSGNLRDLLKNAKDIEEHILGVDDRMDAYYGKDSSQQKEETAHSAPSPRVFNRAALEGWFGQVDSVGIVGRVTDFICPDEPSEKGQLFLSVSDDPADVVIVVPTDKKDHLAQKLVETTGVEVTVLVNILPKRYILEFVDIHAYQP